MSQAQVDLIYKVTDDAIYGFFGPHRFLSNFHVCDIEWEDQCYWSTEAAYQATKTLDWKLRDKFTGLNPSKAKTAGRLIPIRPDWDQIKDRVMTDLCLIKFTRHPDLRDLLLATGDKLLEETNWWGDTYWGVYKGKGDNKLGKILMQVRETIKL